jgi:N-acetylglucosaminyldiphosphoundecaprenol N-acetyl-beta-D-mannosaminyltransferase
VTPTAVNRSHVFLLGLRLDNLSLDAAVTCIIDFLRAGVRGYIVTPNVDHVLRSRREQPFREAYRQATLCLADGMPLVWASRLLGQPLAGRVAGADLVPALCQAAARAGHTVFFLGGQGDVAARAAERLATAIAGLLVAGTYAPPDRFGDEAESTDAAVEAVNRARPVVLFVGLGSPKQELWVHQNWDRLACAVAVCCGAAIDYAARVRPRAPAWMQRAGLEWLWRLAHEPRRLWRRYLVEDVAFLGIFLKEWWRLRVRKPSIGVARPHHPDQDGAATAAGRMSPWTHREVMVEPVPPRWLSRSRQTL